MRARDALVVVALALVASLTSLGNGFAYDDEWIIRDNERVHSLGQAWRLFGQPYWPPENGSNLYRPFTMLGFAVQWALGGGAPLAFHLGSVVLYAAVSVAVLALALALLPAEAALAAAALFAVHPVHVEAVGNVVGQSELWVALACTTAVWLYVRGRGSGTGDAGPRSPLPGPRWLVPALCALYAVAALSKEHGLVLPGLLVLAEILVVRDARPLRARLAAMRPLLLGLALVAVAVVAARLAVVGAAAADTPHTVFLPRTGASRPLIVLATVPEWVRLLLWPEHLSSDYSPQHIPLVRGAEPRVIAGALLLTALAAIAVVAYRRGARVATFGLAWLALAYLPVSNVLVPTGIVLAERVLFLPSVGAMLALGVPLARLATRQAALARPVRLLLGGAVALVLAAGVWRSAARQVAWKDSETVVVHAVADAPRSYYVRYSNGVMLFRQKKPREGERELRTAIALLPHDPAVHVELANRYREAGMCGPALAYYEQGLAMSPGNPDGRSGLVLCLLDQGRFREARSNALVGLSYGAARPSFQWLLKFTDSVMVARGLRTPGGSPVP